MTVRWGIIGAKGIADECTIPGILKANNSLVEAIMDRNEEVTKKIQHKYNIKKAYTDINNLLNDKEIDAIYIATPVYCHREHTILAAKAKKHILLEKPMGLNPEECKEMIDIANENGVKLGVAFMMRFGAYHKTVKKILEYGEIGDIITTRIQYSWWYPDADVWRLDPKFSGGGTVMDLGSHCIDLIQWLVGSKIKSVAALTETKTFHYQVEDSAQIMYVMENGVWGSFNFHFNIPNSISNNIMEIYGTKGSIVCYNTIGREDTGEIILKTKGYNGNTDFNDYNITRINVNPVNRYTMEIETFANSIITCSDFCVKAEDGLNVAKVIAAIYRSSGTKKFEDVV